MAGKAVVSTVEALIAPILAAQQVELYDLEYVKESDDWVLRLYIDQDGGVGINDCERVSRAVEAVLDAADPIPGAYVLEVSSPGVDRLIKKEIHFARYTGEMVDIKLFKPVDGKKMYQGRLQGLIDSEIVISEAENGEMRFDKQHVSSCRLSILF